jgi:hypothetical protein
MAASGNRCSSPLRSGLCGRFFVLRIGLEHEFANALLCTHVCNGAQQREAASFTVDGVRACRESHSLGAKANVAKSLDGNLFEPLSADARAEYGTGDGGELGGPDGDPGKMQAVHSSSALCCNVFHYWRRIERVDVIARACGLPDAKAAVAFERLS